MQNRLEEKLSTTRFTRGSQLSIESPNHDNNA
jgi:hypothetical protein